ncbi:MAG: hypothetical protein ACXABY_27470 [Candidatus Thorarchaeota archaeon]
MARLHKRQLYSPFEMRKRLAEIGDVCPDEDTSERLKSLRDAITLSVTCERKTFFACLRCGDHCFDQFMVKDSVWRTEADLEPRDGVIHLKCLEAIIGRRIGVSDLSDVAMNEMLVHWYELGKG